MTRRIGNWTLFAENFWTDSHGEQVPLLGIVIRRSFERFGFGICVLGLSLAVERDPHTGSEAEF